MLGIPEQLSIRRGGNGKAHKYYLINYPLNFDVDLIYPLDETNSKAWTLNRIFLISSFSLHSDTVLSLNF
jgi:hypothetical protein